MVIHKLEQQLEQESWDWVRLLNEVMFLEDGVYMPSDVAVALYVSRKKQIREKFYEDHPYR